MADVGRPKIMTDATVKVLEEAYSNGATDIEACFIASISKQTLYNYQKEHPEFVDRKFALQDMIKYQAKKNIKEKIISGDTLQSNWWLERKAKKEGFSPRTELTGADGDDLKISVINYGDKDSLQLPTKKVPDTSTESNR